MSTKAATATNGNTDGSTLAAMIGSAGMGVPVCFPPDAAAKPTAASGWRACDVRAGLSVADGARAVPQSQ